MGKNTHKYRRVAELGLLPLGSQAKVLRLLDYYYLHFSFFCKLLYLAQLPKYGNLVQNAPK